MSDKYFIQNGLTDTTEILRVGDDGIVWLLGEGEQDAGYLAWIAEGNTPEPWEEN